MLRGNNDLLAITQPQIIAAIHRDYLLPGADIISTNTFNSTRCRRRITACRPGRRIESRRRAPGAAGGRRGRRGDGVQRFVAGALGPTSRTASLSPDVNDPGFRNISFDELVAAYSEATAR
jgi:5-methyltetrahydrofolate--homocysteine methyltransferase